MTFLAAGPQVNAVVGLDYKSMKIPVKLKLSQIEGIADVQPDSNGDSEERPVVVKLEVPTPVVLPLFILVGGYGLLWVSTWRGVDDDFFIFTGVAVLVGLLVCTLFHRRAVFSSASMMLYYALVFAFTFPIAREITHVDVVQVPAAIASLALSIAMFLGALLRKWSCCKKKDKEPRKQSLQETS